MSTLGKQKNWKFQIEKYGSMNAEKLTHGIYFTLDRRRINALFRNQYI